MTGGQIQTLSNVLGAASFADHDFVQRTVDQARLLRFGELARIDCERLAEEIEDVGRSDYDVLESDLTLLLQHIVKSDHQPARRCRSWELTIREHRGRIERRLKASHSLMLRLDPAIAEAVRDGRDRALAETGLPDPAVSEVRPYLAGDVMTRVFIRDQTGTER